jgi:MoxR-like ATPase
MKKLVPESIEETLQFIHGPQMNEGVVGDWLNKAKGFIQGVFKKVGNFFVGFYKNQPQPAVAPVNVGILCKDKNPRFLSFIPTPEDIKLDPSLASMRSGNQIIKKIRADYNRQAARNRANHKLANIRLTESKRYKGKKLNEERIKLPYSGEDKVRNVNTDFLYKRLLLQTKNPKLMPPCIWGAIGIGKTAITKSVIKSLGKGHRLIDIQTSKMAPDDWSLPSIYKVVGEGGVENIQARDIPKNWLPVYEPSDDPEEDARRNDIANWGEGGIIFLDEISRAITEVQNTCLKIVDERIIGDRKLGSKWAIVAASNRLTDDPEGQVEMSSALANRFQHWNFVPSVDEWIEWAKGAKIDDRILTFVDFNRDHFYLFDNETKVNTTPRSWEALSKMLQECLSYQDIVWSRADLENIIGGTVNSSTVEAFAAFLILLESFKPKEILMIFTDPAKAPKPKKKGTGFDILQANALIGAACSQSKDKKLEAKELENYVKYFCDLGDASLAAKAL